MAALVQPFPQSSSTMTMLQSGPSSASGFQPPPSNQQHRSNNTRSMYGGNNHNGFRGQTSTAPVAPYAFTSTPSLSGHTNPLRQNPSLPHLRPENRAVSAPAVAQALNTSQQNKNRASVTIDSVDSLPEVTKAAQLSSSPAVDLTLQDPRLPSVNAANAAKPSPDRYRRNYRRVETSTAALSSPQPGSSAPSGSGMAAVGHLYNHPAQSLSSPALRRKDGHRLSKDDSVLRHSSEQVKQYRRRSMSGIGNGDMMIPPAPQPTASPTPLVRSYASVVSTPYNPEKRETRSAVVTKPPSVHVRQGSESSVSSRSVSRPNSVWDAQSM